MIIVGSSNGLSAQAFPEPMMTYCRLDLRYFWYVLFSWDPITINNFSVEKIHLKISSANVGHCAEPSSAIYIWDLHLLKALHNDQHFADHIFKCSFSTKIYTGPMLCKKYKFIYIFLSILSHLSACKYLRNDYKATQLVGEVFSSIADFESSSLFRWRHLKWPTRL